MAEEKVADNSQTEAKAVANEKNDNTAKYDVLSIGSAIVDILVKTNDEFLKSLGLAKGSMNLIDKQKADELFNFFSSIKDKEGLASLKEMSGGCAANVAAGVSSFGGKAAFIGRVADDDFGARFTAKMQERSIEFKPQKGACDFGTARSLVVVAGDASRTMCTYLGNAAEITEEDIDEELIKDSKIVFLTAYAFDNENSKKAAVKTIELTKKYNRKQAFTLADYLCVNRHKNDIMAILDKIDILFANKKEINALLGTGDHVKSTEKMVEICAANNSIAALTCSAEGVIIIDKNGKKNVDGVKVDKVVDTTGAGAAFASGFLYGISKGFDLEKCGKIANMAASEAIKSLGARPTIEFKSLLS